MLARAGSAALLLLCTLPGPLYADYVKVSREGTQILGRPGTKAAVVASAQRGQALALVSDQDRTYYLVRLWDGTSTGWILRSSVRRFQGPLPQPAPDRGTSEGPARSGDVASPGDQPLFDPGAGVSGDLRQAAQRHLRIGKPQAVYERAHAGYVTAVDARLKIPVWVQYELTKEQIAGTASRENASFGPDPAIPARAQASSKDYSHSGYAKGHMAPADDFKSSDSALKQTFCYSNACPQLGPEFNGSVWKTLEQALHAWVEKRGRLTIITGPIFKATEPQPASAGTGAAKATVSYEVLGPSQVAVPTAFYKIVVDANDWAKPEVLAFWFDHESVKGRKLNEFLCSVDKIEQATGLDFLSSLPESTQAAVESRAATAVWPAQ